MTKTEVLQAIVNEFEGGLALTDLQSMWVLKELADTRKAIRLNCSMRCLGHDMMQDWARDVLDGPIVPDEC
jgi:hypothetical protein